MNLKLKETISIAYDSTYYCLVCYDVSFIRM